jgi:hypothetical protein
VNHRDDFDISENKLAGIGQILSLIDWIGDLEDGTADQVTEARIRKADWRG